MPEVYAAINALQNTAWRIDSRVYDVVGALGVRVIHDAEPVRKARESREAALAEALALAHDLLGRTFYFPHSLDSRGRCYPMPSFLNNQGSDEIRALPGKAGGPEFWAAVDALGARPYYPQHVLKP